MRTMILLVAVLALSGAAPAIAQNKAAKDIVDTAVAAGSFEKLVAAIQAAGLVDTLKGPGPFTVFAPNDQAFAKLPAGALDKLLADKEALAKVLTYHVVPGKMLAGDVSKAKWLVTAQGQALNVTVDGGSVRIDGAKVLTADIPASNGVIHVIDTVVMPRSDIVDTAVANGSFKTLVTAVKAAGLVETLKGAGPFTVFAPNDAAFAKLPKGTLDSLLKDVPQLTGILTYHVIPGRTMSSDLAVGKSVEVKTVQGQSLAVAVAADGTITVNGAKVITKDIIVGNGVIHVIDAVVLPPTAKG